MTVRQVREVRSWTWRTIRNGVQLVREVHNSKKTVVLDWTSRTANQSPLRNLRP
jgi:hypothetical protein